jgi:hypothetical protein
VHGVLLPFVRSLRLEVAARGLQPLAGALQIDGRLVGQTHVDARADFEQAEDLVGGREGEIQVLPSDSSRRLSPAGITTRSQSPQQE